MKPAESVPESPYVIAVYLRALFDYLRSRGAPLAPVLEACGLHEEDLHDVDRHIDDRAEDRAFVAAERLCDDPDIGLHVGCSMRPTHFGLIGYLMLTCERLTELFDLHTRYAQLVGNGISSRYHMDGATIRLEVSVHPLRPPYHRHSNESNLAGWITMARWLTGTELSPTRIEFPHAQPADTREQEAMFRCPMSWGHDCMRVYFPSSYLAVPMLHGDQGLRRTLDAEARRRLHALRIEQTDRNPQVLRIRQHIADQLSHGVPDIHSVAGALNLAVRSLQRQLDSMGTGYKELVEQVRQSLAERYVHDRSLSLVDVALMLGFAEQSTFQRAFRRWFGTTPGEFRRSTRGPAAPP